MAARLKVESPIKQRDQNRLPHPNYHNAIDFIFGKQVITAIHPQPFWICYACLTDGAMYRLLLFIGFFLF